MRCPCVSMGVLALIVFLSFFGQFFYTNSPYTLHPNHILVAPSQQFWFGTDRLGRDLFARVIAGGKISLLIGFGSAFITTSIGLVIGTVAGYFRGGVDRFIVIAIDLFLTFPTFFLLLALVSYINASVVALVIIISITGWMGTARLIRSESFEITAKPYIKILNIAGVSKKKILFKYYTPLLVALFLVSFTFGVGGAILTESGLSFLGLGVTPPQISWGTILSNGKEVVNIAWWVSFFPGFMIFAVTFSLINISNYIQATLNQKELHF
jgi:peptide/nickel transport system permease protein